MEYVKDELEKKGIYPSCGGHILVKGPSQDSAFVGK